MVKYAIWGRNKHGDARCFALYVAPEDEAEYLERAKKEGWTELLVGKRSQPELFPDESDSSEKATPPTTKRSSSTTSDDA